MSVVVVVVDVVAGYCGGMGVAVVSVAVVAAVVDGASVNDTVLVVAVVGGMVAVVLLPRRFNHN